LSKSALDGSFPLLLYKLDQAILLEFWDNYFKLREGILSVPERQFSTRIFVSPRCFVRLLNDLLILAKKLNDLLALSVAKLTSNTINMESLSRERPVLRLMQQVIGIYIRLGRPNYVQQLFLTAIKLIKDRLLGGRLIIE